jgi:hypothetical protein
MSAVETVESSKLFWDFLQAIGGGIVIGTLVGVTRRFSAWQAYKKHTIEKAIAKASLTPEENRILHGSCQLNEMLATKLPDWKAKEAALQHVLWRREKTSNTVNTNFRDHDYHHD